MGDRALRIVHVTGEVAPYSKTGGLGDVLAELPRFQRAAGLDARVRNGARDASSRPSSATAWSSPVTRSS